MEWRPNNLIIKGTEAAFYERLAEVPTIYQNHCKMLSSDAATESYIWPGSIPEPRQFIDGRSFPGLRDFKFDLTNREYELSILINRSYWEDDQHGLIASRVREMAEVWPLYKDKLFAELLINGGTAGNTAFDGTVFYSDTRVIGSSSNIDNKTTSPAATGTIPTATELLSAITDARAAMRRFSDDQNQATNSLAIRNLRVVIPPTYERAAMEALNATWIPSEAGTATKENVFKTLAQFDTSDNLTSDAKMYINALAAERMPFVYQERTPLELIMLTDAENVAKEGGVLCLSRQRFSFGYGDPRRSIEHTFS